MGATRRRKRRFKVPATNCLRFNCDYMHSIELNPMLRGITRKWNDFIPKLSDQSRVLSLTWNSTRGKASVISCACIQKWIRCKTSSREPAIATNEFQKLSMPALCHTWKSLIAFSRRCQFSGASKFNCPALQNTARQFISRRRKNDLFRREWKRMWRLEMQLVMLQNKKKEKPKQQIPTKRLCMCVIWVTNPAYCQHDPWPLNRLWLNGDLQRNVHTTMGLLLRIVVVSSTPSQNITQMEQFIQRLKVKVHMQTEQPRFVSIHVCVFRRKEAIQHQKKRRRDDYRLRTHRETPWILRSSPSLSPFSSYTQTAHTMRLTLE